MNCYVCDTSGRVTQAVALCQDCGAALCRAHLDADLLAPKPRGLNRPRCTHALALTAERRRDRAYCVPPAVTETRS